MSIIRFYFSNWFSAAYLTILAVLTTAAVQTSNDPLHYESGTWLYFATFPTSPVVAFTLNVIAGWSAEATMVAIALTSGIGNVTAISLIVRGVREARATTDGQAP